jgi:single-stranded-DNA-specific exonuclease
MSDAEISVQLLLCANSEEALALARKIDEENTRRQKVERKILAEARAMVEKQENLPNSLILFSPTWHPGVLGICASRLSEAFTRPSILIAVDQNKGEGRGSARSIQGFDIYNAIKKCSSVLTGFGGHKMAAGLTVANDCMDSFIEKFNQVVEKELTKEDLMPSIHIDAEIPLGQLSYDILEEIEDLAPFGTSNPEPVFSTGDITSYSSMVVGKGHLKLKIKDEGHFFDAIGFNMASRFCLMDEKIRLAFVPQFNLFNGEKIIQLNLKDIKTP